MAFLDKAFGSSLLPKDYFNPRNSSHSAHVIVGNDSKIDTLRQLFTTKEDVVQTVKTEVSNKLIDTQCVMCKQELFKYKDKLYYCNTCDIMLKPNAGLQVIN